MNHQIKLFDKALPESPGNPSFIWFDSLSGIEKINELFGYHNPAHGYRSLESKFLGTGKSYKRFENYNDQTLEFSEKFVALGASV